MYFATPFWLFALVPWLVLAGWMLWGRRRRARVAFLPMWEGPAMEAPPRRGLRLPPAGVVLVLAALLLAIAAAGGPMLPAGGMASAKPTVAVIVDHGLTMSASSDGDGKPRYVAAAEEFARALKDREPGSLPIAVVDPVSDRARWTNLAELAATIAAIPATDLDMRAETAASAARVLGENAGPVVVLSDRPIAAKDPRLMRAPPAGRWNAVAITAIAARATPMPEVMVRLRNDSASASAASAAVTVRSGERSASRTVELPGRGAERDYFFDLPMGEIVEAKIAGARGGRAYLLREGLAAKIFPSPDLPAAVARMVRVYSRQRGKSAVETGQTQSVQVVTSLQAIGGATPAVVAAPAADLAKGAIVAGDDPVTRGVNWSALAGPIRVAANPPDGWRVVLSVGERPMIAVREEPARQTWVGFDAEGLSATPGFVVFWTNVLDWSAGSAQVYAAMPVSPAMAGWRRVPEADDPPSLPINAPGIYARGDGSRQAFDAPVMPAPSPPISAADEAAAIHRLAAEIGAGRGGRDAEPIALWMALGCLVVAAVVWKKG